MSSLLPKDEDDIMTDAISCPNCRQKYGAAGSKLEAKLLNCLDTFCLDCLQRHVLDVSTNYPWSSVSCQLCQTPIEEGSGGVESLRVNPVVEILLRMDAITTNPSTGQLYICDACEGTVRDDSATGQDPLAVAYCEDCDQKLCSACHRAHGKLRPTKQHSKVVQLGSQEAKEMARSWKEQLPKCSFHKTAVADFFCNVCKAFACNACCREHTKKHETPCYPSKQLVQEMRSSVMELAKDVSRLGVASKGKQETILEQKKLFAYNVSATYKEIEKRAKELQDIVELHKTELLEQLEKIRKEKNVEFDEAEDSARRNELRVNRFVKFAQLSSTVDLATLNVLCGMISQRAVKLKEAKYDDHVRLVSVGFTPDFWQQSVIGGGKNCLGNISVDVLRSPPETQTL